MFNNFGYIINNNEKNIFSRLLKKGENKKKWINVTEEPYNVKSDGTDSTKAIQRAFTENPGSVIYFPKPINYYKVSDTILVPDGMTIIFEGKGMIRYEGIRAKNVFYGTNISNFELIGGVIDGGHTVKKSLQKGIGTKSKMAGLYLVNKKRKGAVRINGTNFQNTYTAGCSVVGFKDVKIPECTVENAGYGNQFTSVAGESAVIKDCGDVTVGSFQAKNCTDGMGLLICDNVNVKQAIFTDCVIGISPSACKRVLIGNLIVYRPALRGIDCLSWSNFNSQLSFGADSLSINNAIIHCEDIKYDSKKYRGDGIAIDSTLNAKINLTVTGAKKGFVMNRNYLSNVLLPRRNGTLELNINAEKCQEEGVYLSAVNTVKMNGVILNNSQKTTNSFSGIKLSASNAGNEIKFASLDVISGDNQVKKTQKYGIFLEAKNPYIHQCILKGSLTGNVNAPLKIAGLNESNVILNDLNTK